MRFTEILLAATIITGLIWALDYFIWRPKRMLHVFRDDRGRSEVKEPVLVEYCRAFFPILLIVLILRSFLAEPFRIPSGSMRPTLLEGDFILVNKFDYGIRLPITGTLLYEMGKPKRGDVIVFKYVRRNGESIDMIKRVVGLPGDHVQYKEKTIYINNVAQKQDFIKDTIDKDVGRSEGWPARQFQETLGSVLHDIYTHTDSNDAPHRYIDVVVPNDGYYVMGDNRDNSDDSRSWGFVNSDDILGRAMGIWMSWDSAPEGIECLQHCIRFDRIGMSLNLNNSNKDKTGDILVPHAGSNADPNVAPNLGPNAAPNAAPNVKES